MSLDAFLNLMAGLALAVSLITGRAMLVSFALVCSVVIDRVLFSPIMTYNELVYWAILIALKDAILASLVFLRCDSKELPIAWSFSVSCLLHQWLVVEAQNGLFVAFHYRPDIMTVLVSSILASIILIWISGGDNGGKRVKHHYWFANYRLNHIFYR